MFTQTDPQVESLERVGSLIAGRYRIVSLIGKGGVGTVYEVAHVASGQRFALKRLWAAFESIPGIRRRFEREAKATSRLDHPNIVEALDFGALANGSLFMVMELVRGTSLADVIEAGEMDLQRTLLVIRQILDALHHAHERGIIHRDLKPENVMLVADGDQETVKLLDFGIAKLIGEAKTDVGGEDLTLAGVAFGTPEYMAPEQAMGQVVDCRADLYAVGIMLFEMVTGHRPFEADDPMEMVRRKIMLDPPRLADVEPDRDFSPELEDIIARAIARCPPDRFESAEAMRTAVDRLAKAGALRTENAAIGATVGPDDSLREAALEPEPPVVRAPLIAADRSSSHREAPRGSSRPSVRPRRMLVGLLLLAALSAVVVEVGAKRGGHAAPANSATATGGSSPAEQADRLLGAGDAHAAISLLDKELAKQPGKGDARSYLVLGHAHLALGHHTDALDAYRAAISASPSVRADQRMLTGLASIVEGGNDSTALAALELLATVGPSGRPTIIAQASHGKRRDVRHRAIAIASHDRFSDQVDWLASYSLELEQAPTCRARLDAVAKLRALRDKRAIPVLQRAAGLSPSGSNKQLNRCLAREASAAVQQLEQLP